MSVYIIDASAFLGGASLCFEGDILVPSPVQQELTYGTGKRRLEETLLKGGRVVHPSNQAMEEVKARTMGSDQGLSIVDMGVIAVALENNGIVVSDDYGIQNTCLAMGIPFQPISERGVKEHWRWGFRCTGCGRWLECMDDCPVCGSPVKRKRI